MAVVPLLASPARRLADKVALITGGSAGIGAAIAKLFYKNGAKVVIADVNHAAGAALCGELDPSAVSFVHCDVSKESDVSNAVDTAMERHGCLDVMVNNAGIAGQTNESNSVVHCDAADFQRVLAVNLVGPFLGMKHAARVMIPRRRGSIVTTASVCSVMAGMGPHAYTSSKHGVLGLTRNAAADLGRYGIRVNCVSPYLVTTTRMAKEAMNDGDADLLTRVYSNLKGAELTAEDVAEAAVYLGSDGSNYVSGHNLVVDGGSTISNPAVSPIYFRTTTIDGRN